MNFLGIDIGTTQLKGQLIDDYGKMLCYELTEYSLIEIEGKKYIDILGIWKNVQIIVKKIANNYEIDSIAISCLGESFTLLDDKDNILINPMLYIDNRGEEESKKIIEKFSEDKIYKITGVTPHNMYSLYKLLWIKNNFSEIYKSAKKMMLVGDYINYMLSGERVIDYGLASRTGMFDISKKEFSDEIMNKLNIQKSMMSTPKIMGSIIGNIKASLALELGVKNSCKIVLGSHDQICASIGAGIISSGEGVDGMGTVECITALFDKKITNKKTYKKGYPCVPFGVKEAYCSYLVNFSCGSLVGWFKNLVDNNNADFYKFYESKMKVEATGIYILPYFNGAATPYQDNNAKGSIINLTSKTMVSDIYKAIMESTAYEMKLNLETIGKIGIKIDRLVATGGGSNSDIWLQIKADIMNIPITKLLNTEAGINGTVMLGSVALGRFKDIESAKKVFVKYGKVFLPNQEKVQIYKKHYEKYKTIYKRLKEYN